MCFKDGKQKYNCDDQQQFNRTQLFFIVLFLSILLFHLKKPGFHQCQSSLFKSGTILSVSLISLERTTVWFRRFYYR